MKLYNDLLMVCADIFSPAVNHKSVHRYLMRTSKNALL